MKQCPTRADLHVQRRGRAIHSLAKLGGRDVTPTVKTETWENYLAQQYLMDTVWMK
jgi:hypothetical protein